MLTRLPGPIDAHVHLRTPGQTHKEDLVSGTRAALRGGFTCLLDMPNTTPPIVDEATLATKLAGIHRDALCDVWQFVGGSAGQVEHVASLAEPAVSPAGRAVGLKLYLGQTHGPLLLENPPVVIDLMRRWPGVVAVHAEGWQLAAAISLARLLDRPLYVCHVVAIRHDPGDTDPLVCQTRGYDANGHPLCPHGYPLSFNGVDHQRLRACFVSGHIDDGDVDAARQV